MKIVQWIKTHRYCLTGLYLFVFLAGFFMLQNFGPEPSWIVYSVIDGWIPFNEWFVFYSSFVRGRWSVPTAIEGSRGKRVFGALCTGRFRGPEYFGGTQPASSGSYCKEGSQQKEDFFSVKNGLP